MAGGSSSAAPLRKSCCHLARTRCSREPTRSGNSATVHSQAEFLAPSSGLRSRISRPVVDADDIDELAEEFGVSPYTIEHQIATHQIARISQAADSTGQPNPFRSTVE